MGCCKENSKPQTEIISTVKSCVYSGILDPSRRWGGYQSRTEQVHILVQGLNGSITTKIYKTPTERKHRQSSEWMCSQMKVKNSTQFPPKTSIRGHGRHTALPELVLLWLMWSIHLTWFSLDSTRKLKAKVPDCDILGTNARKVWEKTAGGTD